MESSSATGQRMLTGTDVEGFRNEAEVSTTNRLRSVRRDTSFPINRVKKTNVLSDCSLESEATISRPDLLQRIAGSFSSRLNDYSALPLISSFLLRST